jgi:predicted PurR-regulated permease PerM
MYTENNSWNAVGLFFYSLIITGNIDYISGITILKKLGNVHLIVTVLGIIIGLGLFGFSGFILDHCLLTT